MANNQLARLFVPSKSEASAFMWRMRLIKKWRPKDCELLVRLIDTAKKDQWRASQVKQAKALAASIEIDEVERVEMLGAKFLQDAETMSAKSILFMHQQARWLVEHDNADPVETAEQYRPYIVNVRDRLYDESLPPIRAKLAILELLALMPGQPTLLRLIEHSPVYLKSEIAIKWIRIQQHGLRQKNAVERRRAKANLQSLNKALVGDRRQQAKGIPDKWFVYFRYRRLCEELTEMRKSYLASRKVLVQKKAPHHQPTFDQEYFDVYCNVYEISEEFQRRILSRGNAQSISEIVIEVLVANKLAISAKSFRKVHTDQAKLVKSHQWIGYSILEHLLDARNVIPQVNVDDVFTYLN